MALAWFLAAGLKWGHEAIESRSHLFHLISWAIPALQTVCVLALGKVEGKWTMPAQGRVVSTTARETGNLICPVTGVLLVVMLKTM